MNTPVTALYESDLRGLSLINRGKVRDIYEVDDKHMLIVTTDRLSAFDIILPDPIAGKGQVLTDISNFWFARTQGLIPNHLANNLKLEQILPDSDEYQQVVGRGVLVHKLKPLPIEAIIRGYLIGSGWKDYRATGKVCGIDLPGGLQQAARLPEPIYTPSTKAVIGEHDENISFADTVDLIGQSYAEQVRQISLEIYLKAAQYALSKGIIIADTKLEFGLDDAGQLVLIDEVLTPDSSRFWPVDSYAVGKSPPSFDKQYIRDYLEALDWDKTPPGPKLPEEILTNTVKKYHEARDRLLES